MPPRQPLLRSNSTQNEIRTLYLIRHCAAAGQAPDAALTAEGRRQAECLAEALDGRALDRIVSSPFRRARESIAPLAAWRGLPVEIDRRLAERVLQGAAAPPLPFAELLAALEAGFADLDHALPGGESNRAALARGVAALAAIRAHPAAATAVVTHGNLLTLLLRHFDGRAGFAAWQALTNPDVFQVTVTEHGANVVRLWDVVT